MRLMRLVAVIEQKKKKRISLQKAQRGGGMNDWQRYYLHASSD